MHYCLLVTTAQASSSIEARYRVYQRLGSNGFLEDPAVRWSGGIADWFVIGGRFSGDLETLDAWERFGRDAGARLGHDSDAQLVTAALYDRFLAEHEGWPDEGAFADLEDEPVTRGFVGRKWLVVVDYHR